MGKKIKVVINDCFGGFGLSRAAFLRLRELGSEVAKKEPDFGEKYSDGSGVREKFSDRYESFCSYIERDDPLLIRVVEELGEKASGSCAKLKIVEIPSNVKWGIHDYDGSEHVEEQHRTWA